MKRASSFTLGVLLLVIGVLWLLYLLGVINHNFVFDGWWTLFIIVPSLYSLFVLIIVIGLALIVGRRKPTTSVDDLTHISRDGKDIKQVNVSFGEQKLNFDNQLFQGADISCSFGSIQLDLRHALIHEDVIVKLDCNFSGIAILCPEDVNVQIATSNLLGGTSDKRSHAGHAADAITLFITGNVLFSGVDIL